MTVPMSPPGSGRFVRVFLAMSTSLVILGSVGLTAWQTWRMTPYETPGDIIDVVARVWAFAVMPWALARTYNEDGQPGRSARRWMARLVVSGIVMLLVVYGWSCADYLHRTGIDAAWQGGLVFAYLAGHAPAMERLAGSRRRAARPATPDQ